MDRKRAVVCATLGPATLSAATHSSLFETETSVSHTPNLLPFTRLNGRLCCLRLVRGPFFGGHSDCRCQFSGLVAYLRPQNSALGVALSSPPPVSPVEWSGSNRGILPELGQVGTSTCSSVSDRRSQISVLNRLCEKNHKVARRCGSGWVLSIVNHSVLHSHFEHLNSDDQDQTGFRSAYPRQPRTTYRKGACGQPRRPPR